MNVISLDWKSSCLLLLSQSIMPILQVISWPTNVFHPLSCVPRSQHIVWSPTSIQIPLRAYPDPHRLMRILIWPWFWGCLYEDGWSDEFLWVWHYIQRTKYIACLSAIVDLSCKLLQIWGQIRRTAPDKHKWDLQGAYFAILHVNEISCNISPILSFDNVQYTYNKSVEVTQNKSVIKNQLHTYSSSISVFWIPLQLRIIQLSH